MPPPPPGAATGPQGYVPPPPAPRTSYYTPAPQPYAYDDRARYEDRYADQDDSYAYGRRGERFRVAQRPDASLAQGESIDDVVNWANDIAAVTRDEAITMARAPADASTFVVCRSRRPNGAQYRPPGAGRLSAAAAIAAPIPSAAAAAQTRVSRFTGA